MSRKSSHRVLAVVVCCALGLSLGTLPAAAFPGFTSSEEVRFDFGSWLIGLWREVAAPIAGLFAADGTPPPPPTPPTSNSGITIDPSGLASPPPPDPPV